MNAGDKPTKIEVRGARVHNLKNINVFYHKIITTLSTPFPLKSLEICEETL